MSTYYCYVFYLLFKRVANENELLSSRKQLAMSTSKIESYHLNMIINEYGVIMIVITITFFLSESQEGREWEEEEGGEGGSALRPPLSSPAW